MALPKALLYQLGKQVDDKCENALRAAGFATAVINARELNSDARQWMQLAEILSDDSVQALVISGASEDFTAEERCKITLLTLALDRESPPLTAVICPDAALADATEQTSGPQNVWKIMGHLKFFKPGDPFAAKLMAARFKPAPAFSLPFRLKCYLDPMLGLWIEAAPGPEQSAWPDFMLGVFNADIDAFGVGPAGVLPKNSTLAYPMLGIKGDVNGLDFSACAAKNTLDEEHSCFCRVNGIPQGLFAGFYPDQENADSDFCRELPVSFDW